MDENPVYVKINRKIWHTAQFRSLSPDARELFFYLATCPHGNMLGIYVLRPGYALEDLQWVDPKLFTASLGELLAAGLFRHDPDNNVILDMSHVSKHPPINPHVVTAAIKVINNLPKTPLFHDLKLLVESLGISYLQPLAKQLGILYGSTVTVTVTVTEAEEGGLGGETKHLPVDTVDNSNQDDSPPFLPLPETMTPETTLSKKPETPKPQTTSQNTHGERWTTDQGKTLDDLMDDVKTRYGDRYHQQVYVWLQSVFNRNNPDAVLYCLHRLIQDRLAGKSIPAPGRWLDKLAETENAKAEARESERLHEQRKTDEKRDVAKLIGGIGRTM